MSVFTNCNVVLDLKDLPFKEKKKVRLAITDNGGILSNVVNKQCSFIVVSNLGHLSNNRRQSALKHQVPVVGLEYVQACLDERTLLPASEHILDVTPLPRPAPTKQPVRQQKSEEKSKEQNPPLIKSPNKKIKNDSNHVCNHQIYSKQDGDLPTFPSHFQVAKYSIHRTGDRWSVLELQSAVGEVGGVFRVVCHIKERELEQEQLVFCSCSEDALEVFQQLQDRLTADNLQLHQGLPPHLEHLASPSLKQLLLEEKLNCSTLSQEVGVFVELVWTEALGSLTKVLRVPALSVSPNDVSRAEGLLLQVRRSEEESERKTLLEDLRSVLPHTLPDSLPPAKLTSQLLDLCQVLRDTLSVHEAVMWSSNPSSLGKYRALGCSIETLHPQSPDYHTATQLLHTDQHRDIQIHQVFHVRRGAELQMFREELGNIKPLLHSTSPASFVGILSRGLLLPRVGVEHHGVQRTDVGFLGGGIYFSDSFSTSVKYSKPGVTDGSRLLLVCEVALGHCREFRKKDTTLTCAPEGYDSVHGVRSTPRQPSEFEDDEYVVFRPEQVRLKYVVQYSLPDEQLRVFQPHVDTSVVNSPQTGASDTLDSEDSRDFEDVKNPLDSVTAGLLDSAGQTLPLQAVHVKCKLVDLLSQVIIFQTYSNPNPAPIEAKYVLPLEESAAVCGFEAFINGKHVIGQVKEKEQARKEYRQAIERGHGAYLMDQEAPDVFTISVGNLPPGATVLIKVTFISELLVRDDLIIFKLPGSVAPWQQNAALNERTQGTVEKVCVSELKGEFSLSLSIEMPYKITYLDSPKHRIQYKRTDCKAMVSTLPGQTLGSDGFQLSIRLAEMQMPRMWVESHPDKDSQACMLVFYPDFGPPRGAGEEARPACGEVQEVLLLLDSSESMRGEALLNARRIALHFLSRLDQKLKINIVLFGTDYKDVFSSSKVVENAFEAAVKFIQSAPPVGGSTELWRPLRGLSLLPPSQGTRSLVLLSDGHVQNPTLTLQLLRSNAAHTRLFTCGLSKTANKHMLRALAQASGGAYEFFDTKARHTWSNQVESQVRRLSSPGCSSVAVKWQLFNPTAPPPVQAPAQLHALFSNFHTLIYGFVPHCTQATLHGDLCGKEINTMVSTTELQKTKGTFLHKLTARAVIRDYEDGILHMDEAEHEGKKAQMKSFIIELSKEFSILSQFTSFVAIEERDAQKPDEGFTDIPKVIAEEDVDLLPYMAWKELVNLVGSGGGEQEALDWWAYVKEEDLDLDFDLSLFQCSSASTFEEEDDLDNIPLYGLPSCSLVMPERNEKSTDNSIETDGEKGPCDAQGSPDGGPVADPPRLMDGSAFDAAPKSPWESAPSSLTFGFGLPSAFSLGSSSAVKLPQRSFSSSASLWGGFTRGAHHIPGSSPPPPPPPNALGNVAFSPVHVPPPLASPLAFYCDDILGGPFLGRAPVGGLPLQRQAVQGYNYASGSAPAPADCASRDRASGAMGASFMGRVAGAAPALKSIAPIGPAPESFTRAYSAFSSSSVSFEGFPSAPSAGGFGFSFGGSFTPIPTQFIPPGSSRPPSVLLQGSQNVASAASPLPPPPPPPLGSGLFGSTAAASPPPPPPPPLGSGLFGSTAAASPPPLGSGLFGSPAAGASPLPPPPLGSGLFSSTAAAAASTVPKRERSKRTKGFRGDAPAPLPPPSLLSEMRPILYSSISTQDHAAPDVAPDPSPLPPPLPPRRRGLLESRLEEMPHILPACFHGPSVPPPPPANTPGHVRAPVPSPSPSLLPQMSQLSSALQSAGPHAHMDASYSADSSRQGQAALGFGDPSLPGSAAAFAAEKMEILTRLLRKQAGVDVVNEVDSGPFVPPLPSDNTSVHVSHSMVKHALGMTFPCELKPSASWEQLACLQNPEGYWECTEEVGKLLCVDLSFFANVFLKEKGISSLGPKAHADILRLVSTLLVLQLVRVRKLVQGELLQSLFRLRDTPQHSSPEWEALKRAVAWVCWADRQYPCVCSRLEFGRDWESSTRQLLGFDRPHPLSPLNSLLERSRVILAC